MELSLTRERSDLRNVLTLLEIQHPVRIITWQAKDVRALQERLEKYFHTSAFNLHSHYVKENLKLLLALTRAKLAGKYEDVTVLLRSLSTLRINLLPIQAVVNTKPTQSKREPLSPIHQPQPQHQSHAAALKKLPMGTPIKRLFKSTISTLTPDRKTRVEHSSQPTSTSIASASGTAAARPTTATATLVPTTTTTPAVAASVFTRKYLPKGNSGSSPEKPNLRSPIKSLSGSSPSRATQVQIRSPIKISPVKANSAANSEGQKSAAQKSPMVNKSSLVSLLSPLKRSMQADFAELLRLTAPPISLEGGPNAVRASSSPDKNQLKKQNAEYQAAIDSLKNEIRNRELELQVAIEAKNKLLERIRAEKYKSEQLEVNLQKEREKGAEREIIHSSLLVRYRELALQSDLILLERMQIKTENSVLQSKVFAFERERGLGTQIRHDKSKDSRVKSPVKKATTNF